MPENTVRHRTIRNVDKSRRRLAVRASHRQSTPAGWHSDPLHDGGFRFWDGNGWTEQRLDHDPGQIPTPGESPAGWYFDPLKVDTYRRWNGADWTDTHTPTVPTKQSILADVSTGSRRKVLRVGGVIAAVVVVLCVLGFVLTRFLAGSSQVRGTSILLDDDIAGDLTDCSGTGAIRISEAGKT